MKVYNRTYKTRNARIRYGIMTKEEFKTWSVQARKERDKALNGTISLDEFEEWLKEH